MVDTYVKEYNNWSKDIEVMYASNMEMHLNLGHMNLNLNVNHILSFSGHLC